MLRKFGKDKEALFLDKDLLSWTEMQSQKELSQGILDKLVSGFSDFLKSVSSFTLGSGTDDISFSACKQLIQEKINAEKTLKEIEQKEKDLEKSSGSEDKAEDRQKMATAAADVQSMIRNNERMYGWLNSLIVPSSVMLFEMQSLAQNSQTQTFEDLQKAINTQNTYSAQNNNQSEALSDSIFAKASQWLTSYLLPLTLPGASSLRTTILNAGYDEKTGEVTSNLVRFGVWDGACGYATYKEFKDASSIIGKMGATAAGIICASGHNDPKGFGGFVGSLFIIHAIYSSVLEYLPTVIASVAGILAFLGYFVSLCKYYYISPFVVAFALTTKRVDKIINFLITGITIFFKPVLIVLFIYLALFLYALIGDFFVFAGLTQFNIIPRSLADISGALTFGIIRAIILFLGTLASVYMIWKTIMTGPDWTFKLLGLDKDSDNTIVSSLSNKMETKAVVV